MLVANVSITIESARIAEIPRRLGAELDSAADSVGL